MGAAISAVTDTLKAKADAEMDETEAEMNQMMRVLLNKKMHMLAEIERSRGDAESVKSTQVAGGRTVMRLSEMRVSTGTGLDDEIQGAIHSFFKAAQGSIDGDDKSAKHAAVTGAENLLSGGIKALLGVRHGQSREQRNFVVLFMNNAFVRVDYWIYTYSMSAKAWGEEKHKSGSVYVTDLAVLDIGELRPSEIDFLLSQALSIGTDEISILEKMKIRLVESAVLSKMLQRSDTTFATIADAAQQLAAAENEISAAFTQMADFDAEKAKEEAKKRNAVAQEEAKKKTNGSVKGDTTKTQSAQDGSSS